MLLNFDPCFEDPHALRQLSRRGFLARVLGGTAAGAAFLALGAKALSAPVPDIYALPRGAPPEDEAYWERVANQFLLRPGLTYMNTGTRGPSPRSVHQAQLEALESVNSDIHRMSSSYFFPELNSEFRRQVRQKMAAFVGAKPHEIAFTNNTTEGMIFGAMGVDLKPGDQILYTNHDHVFGVHPILHRAAKDGLDVQVIDLSDHKYHPPRVRMRC